MVSLIRKMEKDILKLGKVDCRLRYVILNLFLILLKESRSNREILMIQCATINTNFLSQGASGCGMLPISVRLCVPSIATSLRIEPTGRPATAAM